MSLEPRLRPVVALGRRAERHDPSVPVVVRRARSAAQSRMLGWLVMRSGPRPAAIEHHQVPVDGGSIRVRVYRPVGTGPFPLYVFLHGGGWCVGTIDERDPRCTAVSAGASCVVVSVDYRMAPENRFPTAVEDCYSALCWAIEHAAALGIDPDRVAIGGESAGANLAAVCALIARDRHGPRLCHQWLDVPATDMTFGQEGHANVPDGYLLDEAILHEYTETYLGDADPTDPLASPLLAPSHAGLAPAWIMTAEFDRLRGDGAAYAAALERAGVVTQHTRLRGHVHASFAFTRLLPSSAAYERSAISALVRAFGAVRAHT